MIDPRAMGLAAALLLVGLEAQARPFYAPPAPPPDAPVFSGSAELGYTQLSGNTDSQTLIGKANLTWLTGDWTHGLRAEVRNVSRDGASRAERYLLALRERVDLTPSLYLFGFARWDKDRFSGYDRQVTAIVGYGRQVLDGELHRLSLEAGPGYRHDRVSDDASERLAVGYAAADYEWQVFDYASLQQTLSVEGTRENVTSRSLSALTAQLNARLALRLSHEVQHNSRPPVGADARTDQITSASLLYRW